MITPSWWTRSSGKRSCRLILRKDAQSLCREVSNKEFNSNDTRGPKSISAFIVKLSELAPRLVIKQMTLLAKQLDSEVSPFGEVSRSLLT